MTFYVDRLEGVLAVVQREDGVIGVTPRDSLPNEAREGRVLKYENGVYLIDREREAVRKKGLNQWLMRLLNKE